ncbi:asparagine synthetase B family protein [Flavobacterium jejuense]|uniref:asparagine synthase (glutamine-hydrolyzing) n=1 Tax=Flavobacterium jejuense TaxID=1544455 RepID=A0ABX0ITP1_9FLAO|nr:asparagine synthase-related protein [Flavobacterium jejuense]NHN26172.1 asparagine synthetase B family protein [Flavobacterium jejuense]
MNLKTPIIPNKLLFLGERKKLHYEAICVFAATGFFLEDDTYYKEQKVLKPATSYSIEENRIVTEDAYFKWHYSPVERPLEQIVQEFATLFETIIKEQVLDKTVILPLSGGLDSRTQAAALYHLGNKVNSYSYEFQNGHNETHYSEKIAKACNFSFQKWQVTAGYLWDAIEDLAKINQCYSEFTHPRQMAFIDKYATMGDVFSLGHWGDVLFDDMQVADDLSNEEQVTILLKKVVKKGGLELANNLWKSWSLEGEFEDYLKNRIRVLLGEINITSNANAQIRAFKSLYWAPRWTSTNLSVFESVKPISLPYYDNRMCEFICTIPEKYLAGRQIQIEYLKLRMPALAKITWQDHRPFNLYHYKYNKFPYNFPYRVFDKLKRVVSNKKFIQRNWELQFLGKENEKELEKWLFENDCFKELINEELLKGFYLDFNQKEAVYYSHAVSMLLTLSLFTKQNDYEK